MAFSIARVARFLLFIGTAATSARAALCENPSVRKEWRALSVDERAEWIEAVNVRLCLFTPSCFGLNPLLVSVGATPRP